MIPNLLANNFFPCSFTVIMYYHLPRAVHLDCLRIDHEIENYFTSQINSLVRQIHASSESWGPEIGMLLKLVILKNTIGSSGRTIAQRLLSCQYVTPEENERNSRNRLVFHVFADGTAAWLHQRIDDLPIYSVNRDYVRIFKAFSFILQTVNVFAFLFQGKYASLSERVFRVTMKSTMRTRWNALPHAVLVRELMWSGLAEFFLFLWPLIRRSRWMARIRRLRADRLTHADDGAACLLCRQSPKIQPHQFCAHSFCYYCVTTAFVESEFFACPVCGEEMTVMADLKPACPSFEI